MQCDHSDHCCIKWSYHWAAFNELRGEPGGTTTLLKMKAAAGKPSKSLIPPTFLLCFPQQKGQGPSPPSSCIAKSTRIFRSTFACYQMYFSLHMLLLLNTQNLHPTGLSPTPVADSSLRNTAMSSSLSLLSVKARLRGANRSRRAEDTDLPRILFKIN